jgi:competence protein ComEC
MPAIRALISLAALVSAPALAEMRITFIDAGQADASVVQIVQAAGEPYTIVVDGGDGDGDLRDNLPGFLGAIDSTIELVVLSHPHRDHTGALDWLVNESGIPIERVWLTGEVRSESNYDLFLAGIAAGGIAASRPEETFYHVLGVPNLELRVLNNGQEFAGTDGDAVNNDSLVFQVIFRPSASVTRTVLFTGDIEAEQGEMLVQQFGAAMRSDIVKVPHHGSAELFPGFPTAVGASIAVVMSSGTHGTFMHPRKAALDRYDATGRILCTCDAAGNVQNITVTVSNAGGITFSPTQAPYFAWALTQQIVTPGP